MRRYFFLRKPIVTVLVKSAQVDYNTLTVHEDNGRVGINRVKSTEAMVTTITIMNRHQTLTFVSRNKFLAEQRV